jgi:hypothetical protein
MTDAPPTTFNLSEEEKAILRKTLRVIALEPDRIEFAVKSGKDMPRWLLFAVLLTAADALMVTVFLAYHDVPVANLVPLFSTLLALSLLLGWMVFSKYDVQPIRSVCLFAGSAWVICRGRRIPSYELLVELDPIKTTIDGETRYDPRPRLHTDVRMLALRRRRFNELDTNRCRAVLTKLIEQCTRFPNPSPAVQALGDADRVPWRLPRPQYKALIDHPWLVSLSPDELVLRLTPRQWHMGATLVLCGTGDLGLFWWLGFDSSINYSHGFPWPQSLVVILAMILFRLPLPLIPRSTVHLRRSEGTVAITSSSGSEEFPSSGWDISYHQAFFAVDNDEFSAQSFTLWRLRPQKQAVRQRGRKIATWHRDPGTPERNPEIRHAALALRYYLNLPAAEDPQSPKL